MEFFNSHVRLFTMAFLLFIALTLMVAILPAMHNQNTNKPLPNAQPLTASQSRGKGLFISNGCVACHTQQVRSIAMDSVWGKRPGMAADYADNYRISLLVNTATLMGTERTGPDLTNIGERQPSKDWNLLHLYQPRAVVKESIMPAYPHLFGMKSKVNKGDVVVNVPGKFKSGSTLSVVATQDALDLVAYLNSLKQVKIPAGEKPVFLYGKLPSATIAAGKTGPDGKSLYSTHCQSCHQSSGEGLPGAFPALKGSKIVQGENLELYVDIIMNGYDAREEYGVMPKVGTNAKFTEKEVAAIINHERSSWGNTAKPVTEQQIRKIIDLIKQKTTK